MIGSSVRCLYPFVVGSVVAGFLSLGAGCKRHDEVVASPPPAIVTLTVQSSAEPALSRRGVVAAGARLRLGFNAPGVLLDIGVKTGDVVHKGQVLARLKSTDAAAELQSARATLARAQRDLRIADVLASTGSAPAVQRDDARSALSIATANASLAAEWLGQREIASPIDGTVLARLAEPGEAVVPGAPVLVVEGTRRLIVKVGVNERELKRVHANQSVTLVAEGNDAPITGTVSGLAPAPGVDGLYDVEIAPASVHTSTLRPGTLVTVLFVDDEHPAAVSVPLDALVYRNDRACAFIVSGSTADPTVRLRELEVDRADRRDVVVRAGLKDGERIVREGAQFLFDGESVRLLD
jgi:RND family efflux transporter MFP subunit